MSRRLATIGIAHTQNDRTERSQMTGRRHEWPRLFNCERSRAINGEWKNLLKPTIVQDKFGTLLLVKSGGYKNAASLSWSSGSGSGSNYRPDKKISTTLSLIKKSSLFEELHSVQMPRLQSRNSEENFSSSIAILCFC